MKFFASIRKRQGHALLLIALAIVTIALFILTTLVVNAFARLESRLGTEWYDRGTADLRAGHAEKAVIDLRTALSYSREVSYRLQLARALVAAGRKDEAREYLLSLWERQPGSAELNLELARVAALSQAIPAAIGYYDAAIYGAWDNSPELNRRTTRLELASFLVAHNDKRRALAVLNTVASDLPPDPDLQTDVGNLLLLADDPATARRVFESALRTTRGYVPAILGAGNAAFAAHDFPAAQRYFSEYLRRHPEDGKAQSELQITRAAIESDPLAQHLSAAQRRARVLRLFNQAHQRISECSATLGGAQPPPDIQGAQTKLASQSVNANERNLRRNPDLVEDLFSVAASAFNVSAKWCGPATTQDQAVSALAQLHGVRP